MNKRVAVIYGGRSGEHEISIRSAKAVMDGLRRANYEVVEYFISKEGKWSPSPILPEPGGAIGIDVVFPILHGTFGEDGTVQGLLELADLPYVGANVLSSSVSMDKEMMKRVCVERGLPIGDFLVLRRGQVDLEDICRKLPFPMFVKPANLGSSVGISKAHNVDELQAALTTATEFDRKVLVERGIEGREFECAVLGNENPKASTPCEIHPSREFYDYEDKYLLDKAVIDLPAKLTPDQTAEMQRLAVACYEAVDCEGMARVDFLMESSTGRIYVNEINTIPGFTSISMFPKMWEYSGVPFVELVDRLVQLALERHETKRATRFTR